MDQEDIRDEKPPKRVHYLAVFAKVGIQEMFGWM